MMGQSGIHHNEHERSLITSVLERPPPAGLGLQAHFSRPTSSAVEGVAADPLPPPHRPEAAPSPSLVGEGITHEATPHAHCQWGRWVLATCSTHNYERWLYRPCKRRDCPICGIKRRKRVAWRIASGLELLSPEHGGGWFVGTWPEDVPKSAAVRTVARFVARLRRNFPHPIEYACTWENTAQGRLHVNLIFAPWTYLPQRTLSAWWHQLGGGKVVWIKRVGEGIGQEAAKSREAVARYFAKWEQMVRHGRAATYSRRWPALPDNPAPKCRGHIIYEQEWQIPSYKAPPALDPNDVQLALWQQPRENEYRDPREPWCDCFDRVDPAADSLPRDPPPSLTLPQTLCQEPDDHTVCNPALF